MTDALQTLWQDSPPIDADAMVARLNRNNRDIRAINLWSAIISIAVFAVLVGLEWSGSLHTDGMMTLLGGLCLLFGGGHYFTGKRKLHQAYSGEPKALIAFMIKRTRAAINLGRMLYICPIPSLSFGYVLSAVTPDRPRETPMPEWIDPIIFSVAIGFFIVPTVLGIWFTRKKLKELKELEVIAADLNSAS